MQHTSRKGPRAACSQPSWFERDDLHLRDERVERPSFVGVGQKSSCIVSYTAAAAPRRRAFFMGRVLRDFAVVKKRLCDGREGKRGVGCARSKVQPNGER